MPTALERAQEQEARKLAQAGFNPDGTPMNAPPGGDDPGDDPGGDGDDPAGQRQSITDDGSDLRSQISKLQADLAAANNRAAPEQQRAQEMRDLWQNSERARLAAEQEARERIEALQAQLDASRPAFDINSVLSDEEREAFDPATLALVAKVSEAMVKAHAPKTDARTETLKVLEERERNRVDEYRKKVLTDPTKGLHQLAQLSYDPEFQRWSQEDDNDMESVVTSLLQAKSTEEVDRFTKIVAKRITRFKERDTNGKPTDTRTSLETGMRRSGKPVMTKAESEAKYAEAKRLARGNAADRAKAQLIIDELK